MSNTMVITATTVGRSACMPSYETRKPAEKGDIPNHLLTTILFLKKDLKPNEKIVITDGIINIVEKSLLNKLFEKIKSWL